MKNRLSKITRAGSDIETRFIEDYDELVDLVNEFQSMDKQVVLTQGVYDLIHEGHALYLEKAKSFGDVLIVGVDSDELTRKRKGENRPVVPEQERLKMLVHLRHVDVVTLRHVHHDIGELIQRIKPDVLVVSESTKDFSSEQQKEYSTCCGRVEILPSQAPSSTTGRIRLLTIDGAQMLSQEIEKVTKNFLQKIQGKEK